MTGKGRQGTFWYKGNVPYLDGVLRYTGVCICQNSANIYKDLDISFYINCTKKIQSCGTSLVVQWFKNMPSNAKDTGLIPGQEAKIPHATGQLSPCTAARESLGSNEDAAQPRVFFFVCFCFFFKEKACNSVLISI